MNFIGEEILRKLYLDEKLTMKETARGCVWEYAE